MDKTTAQALIIAHLMGGNDVHFQNVASKLAALDPVLFCQLAGLGVPKDWTHTVIEQLKNNELVPAIKTLRAAMGCGLKEAKDAVYAFRQYEHRAYWGDMADISKQAVQALRKTHGKDVL